MESAAFKFHHHPFDAYLIYQSRRALPRTDSNVSPSASLSYTARLFNEAFAHVYSLVFMDRNTKLLSFFNYPSTAVEMTSIVQSLKLRDTFVKPCLMVLNGECKKI